MTPALHSTHLLDRIFGQLKARNCNNSNAHGSSVPPLSTKSKGLLTQHGRRAVPEGSSPAKRPRQAGAEGAAEGSKEGVAEGLEEGHEEGWSDQEQEELAEAPEQDAVPRPSHADQHQWTASTTADLYGLR